MKALLLTAPSTFDFTDVPAPEVGTGEVRISVKACGICGSDIHGMDGRSGRRIPPIVMGHEAAGVVSEIGEGVVDWKVGDRVTFDSTEFCGECAECERGNFNLCANRKVLGVSCGDYRRHGCFAEEIVLPERILHRIPDSLSFEKAAFAEPVAIALHAVNLAPEDLEAPAVVIGAGLIGLLVIQSLKARGWKTVIAVDLDESRLALAKELGASLTFSARQENLASHLRDICGGDGAAVAFEVVGAAAPVDLAIRCVCKGGTVVLVGNLQPSVPMPLQEVVTRQISLRGSCACAGEYPEAIRRIGDGSIQVEPLLSASVPLAEGGDWFARLAGNTEGLLKVVLKP
ncbi:galactitol-1-phosphate 5-dehydrogenase [Luteolibacter yonseiensis]|uniref:Galactitol-1-phosphate 5-dehydrogenase n=1 Tax=Luteolibacter yonseiensis TaxID=1144680 RepID=A0A934R828_9BACT|nr:galactitol-1-phosphate 5-dehydrogenase [Luteolibacter yonseiensis]MBK1817170.1 galactitol-1-phosphate 5-dehydrogenase [Luteolibacter yonseiensis]